MTVDNPGAMPCARHLRTSATPLLVVIACGLALTACDGSTSASAAPPPGRTYTLLQMNLCLSGIAGCYQRVRYPKGILNVVARIRALHPDAVTLNEACRGDIQEIARRTGYHMRYSIVKYGAGPLRCIDPGDRGVFGDALLTRAPIVGSQTEPFASQRSKEQRRWLCARTRVGVQVCTAHLASPASVEAAANAPQCAELGQILRHRAGGRPLIFGGDVNRVASCAPAGFWTRDDIAGHEDAGSQQVYGTPQLTSPTPQVTETSYTDHDVLVVRARLASGN
jgi:endonuclease/exonuclease/phosphatase family metal-dependent hydrolase